MTVSRLIICFMGVLLICGCKKATLVPEEYIRWVDSYDNGLIKFQVYDKIKYSVAYRPGEYNLAKALIKGDSTAIGMADMGHYNFIVKMEPVDGKTQILTINAQRKEEPFERINYYLSEAPNYIKLIAGKDTLPVTNYHYERYYNLSPAQCLVLGFDKLSDKDQPVKLLLEDKVFSTGKLAFVYDQSTLKNIPSLIRE